jgi:tetratricopeptide (TPR) repeat protein
LSKLATKTGGGYLRVDAQHFGVEAIEAALAGLKRTEADARLVRQYDEVFVYLLLPALLLLVIEACLGERRRRLAPGSAPLVLAMLMPFLGAWSPLERSNRDIEAGNASLKGGKAEEALAAYDKAVAELPGDAGAHFNRGNALFALSRFEEASAEFLRATQTTAPALRPLAFYNLGNSYFKNDKYEDAIAAYRHSLALDPTNRRAKWNLELALQKKKEADKKKEEEKKKQDDKQEQDKKNQDKKDQDKKDQKDQKDEEKRPDDQQKEEEKQEQDSEQQQQQQEQKLQPEQAEKAPDLREIDAVLDNLERSPKDLEKMRARLRAVRRAPPAKDW